MSTPAKILLGWGAFLAAFFGYMVFACYREQINAFLVEWLKLYALGKVAISLAGLYIVVKLLDRWAHKACLADQLRKGKPCNGSANFSAGRLAEKECE